MHVHISAKNSLEDLQMKIVFVLCSALSLVSAKSTLRHKGCADPNGNCGEAEDCHPKCQWKCDAPVCNQVCEPICEPPKCSTRCQELTCSKCSIKCNKPECEVRCPVKHCEKGRCPECDTVCKDPLCHTECSNPAPICESVCEEPVCDWKCHRPSNCPKPKCALVCENSQHCQGVKTEQQPNCDPCPCANTKPTHPIKVTVSEGNCCHCSGEAGEVNIQTQTNSANSSEGEKSKVTISAQNAAISSLN